VPASSSSLRASHVQVELAAYQHGSQRLDSKAAEGESASTSSSLPDLGRLTLSDTCTISSEERGGAHSSQPPPLSSALPSQAGSCGGNADGEALEAGAGACSSAELDANGIARIRRQQTMAKIRDMAERRSSTLLLQLEASEASERLAPPPRGPRRWLCLPLPRWGPIDEMNTLSRSLHGLLPAAGWQRNANMTETRRRLQDPVFVRAVSELMKDPHMCATFELFDSNATGYVSVEELERMIHFVNPHQTKGESMLIIDEVDANGDGKVDLWEFCVHMQIMRERTTVADATYEIEQAFLLFEPDVEGFVSKEDLRRIFMCESSGYGLSEDEFEDLLRDVGMQSDGRVRLQRLRKHPAFRCDLVSAARSAERFSEASGFRT